MLLARCRRVTCADVRHICDSVGQEGIVARMTCPLTCGCGAPTIEGHVAVDGNNQGRNLTLWKDPSYGCPPFCIKTLYSLTRRSEFNPTHDCQDLSVSTMRMAMRTLHTRLTPMLPEGIHIYIHRFIYVLVILL